MASISYLTKSIKKYPWNRYYICQNCGHDRRMIVDRKYVVTQLNRCDYCSLLYRTPVDTTDENVIYYNNKYSCGFTTDMPNDMQLASFIETNFKHTEKDYSYYIDVLRWVGLTGGSRVFDYGCSWGYGSFQLARAGFDVMAYEISRPRAVYAAEKLKITLFNNVEQLEPYHHLYESFDCFFSAHVLEHVPSPSKIIDIAFRLLKDGGVFVAFMPNGCQACRDVWPQWSKLWGEVHPNFIDDVFLNKSFSRSQRVLSSSPVPVANTSFPLRAHEQEPRVFYIDDISRIELCFIARKARRSGSW